MNIVLVSNYYNHHQKSVCDALYNFTAGQFTFIATEQISEMRKALGYTELCAPYVVSLSQEEYNQVIPLVEASDVILIGSVPKIVLKMCISLGKPVFRYSEHLLKKGFQWWKYPYRWLRMHRDVPSAAPIYMLCASAYTADDYAKFGLFKGKTYKWGYFPECKRYANIDDIIQKKDSCEILWCGRFLDWKHPDDMLTIAKRLNEENISFHISIIGTGEMEGQLKQFISKNDLIDRVALLGSMPPEKVREHMERAGIYLFTSDRKEGWGAVLNEAMNSGCAVVAADQAGSTPYLVSRGDNGLIYPSCDTDQLYDYVKYLLDRPDEQARLGRSAYETIVAEWNAEFAAERLVNLVQRVLNGEKSPKLYGSGPCSMDYRKSNGKDKLT